MSIFKHDTLMIIYSDLDHWDPNARTYQHSTELDIMILWMQAKSLAFLAIRSRYWHYIAANPGFTMF